MRRFKLWFFRFFSGRYGTDTLNKTLTWVYISVTVVYFIINTLFFTAQNVQMPTIIAFTHFIASTGMIVWLFFRMFSRNIPARRRENEKFCGFFKLRKNKFRDRKTHVYRKCPKCKAMLRLPKSKGKHYVVCPRCKNRFEVKG